MDKPTQNEIFNYQDGGYDALMKIINTIESTPQCTKEDILWLLKSTCRNMRNISTRDTLGYMYPTDKDGRVLKSSSDAHHH